MYSTCHSDESANTGSSFQGQKVPGEEHNMDGMLLEEPPQPLDLPPPSPRAECPKAADTTPRLDVPSICQGVGCNRQAKFGYEGGSRTACAQHRLEAMVLRTRKGCETPHCHRAAIFGFDVKEQATACGVHKVAGMVDLKHKRCEVVDCVRHRVYGALGGKARFCSRHKEPGMCNVVSRKCSIEGCSKIPTHVSKENKGDRVCTSHKVEGMINVSTNRPCDASDCSRNPIFGFEGQRSTRCAAHKEEGMLDVKHARCLNGECNKVAAYAFEGEKPRFCYGHKEAGMLSMKHRRCARSSCTRQPVFGFPGGKATLCSGHKVDGMENVLDKCCSAPACRKLPTFGPEDGKATACASHKAPGMVNVRNRRCEIHGCSKQPRFGMLGEKPLVCLNHTRNGMAELRPAHQGRNKKMKLSDPGSVSGAFSPVPVLPTLPHAGRLAGVGLQPTLSNLAFRPSMASATSSSTLQGVGFDVVAPHGVAPHGVPPQVGAPQGVAPHDGTPHGIMPQGIMPQGILLGGFSSKRVSSGGFSAQGIFPQAATTTQGMSQAPTPEVSVKERVTGESGVPFSDALQAVSPSSTGLQSTMTSPAMVTGQAVSTHPVGVESEVMVPMMSGQSVLTRPTGLPSETVAPVMTTRQHPPLDPTTLPSTVMSPAMTTGEPASTNSTGLQSETIIRTMSTGQFVPTHPTDRQSEMAPVITIGQPLSHSSTTLHSTVMSPAIATGQPDSTHSTGLRSEPMAPTGSRGVVDMQIVALGDVPNAAAPAMQPAVFGNQACQQHKQSGMMYGFGLRCRFGGCSEQPQYGFDDEGPRFCPRHKRDGMSDRATASGCEVEHSGGSEMGEMGGLGSPSEGQSYVHQAAAMMGGDAVKMQHQFCVWESCLQPPAYSWSGEDSPRFCEAHSSPGMVPPSTGGHPCRYHACLKQACFAFEGEACRFCPEHCVDGMLEAESRQCHHEGCTGLAPYSRDLHSAKDGYPSRPVPSPVKDSYPSLSLPSDSISPLVDDDAAPHDLQSQKSHHFSDGQGAHHEMVHGVVQEPHQGMVDAVGASGNVDESDYLGTGSGGVDGQPLSDEDTGRSHADEGSQSPLLHPSAGQAVGVDMAPHRADDAPEHHPSSFHHHHLQH